MNEFTVKLLRVLGQLLNIWVKFCIKFRIVIKGKENCVPCDNSLVLLVFHKKIDVGHHSHYINELKRYKNLLLWSEGYKKGV